MMSFLDTARARKGRAHEATAQTVCRGVSWTRQLVPVYWPVAFQGSSPRRDSRRRRTNKIRFALPCNGMARSATQTKEVTMIIGCYSMDLYCDGNDPAHLHDWI